MKYLIAALLVTLMAGCSTAPLNKTKTCPVKYDDTHSYDSVGMIKVASEPKTYKSHNDCL